MKYLIVVQGDNISPVPGQTLQQYVKNNLGLSVERLEGLRISQAFRLLTSLNPGSLSCAKELSVGLGVEYEGNKDLTFDDMEWDLEAITKIVRSQDRHEAVIVVLDDCAETFFRYFVKHELNGELKPDPLLKDPGDIVIYDVAKGAILPPRRSSAIRILGIASTQPTR